jgi:Ca2+-binding EF-hand superfamily protein
VVSIPAPSAERQILMQHLQKAFQRLDKEGSGVCPTGPLLRALQLILSSQASSSRSSGGWARGLRAVCEELAAKVAALQEQPGLDRELDNLTVAWEEVLELATEDIRARGAEA